MSEGEMPESQTPDRFPQGGPAVTSPTSSGSEEGPQGGRVVDTKSLESRATGTVAISAVLGLALYLGVPAAMAAIDTLNWRVIPWYLEFVYVILVPALMMSTACWYMHGKASGGRLWAFLTAGPAIALLVVFPAALFCVEIGTPGNADSLGGFVNVMCFVAPALGCGMYLGVAKDSRRVFCLSVALVVICGTGLAAFVTVADRSFGIAPQPGDWLWPPQIAAGLVAYCILFNLGFRRALLSSPQGKTKHGKGGE
jgi:hypothetical protein